MRHRLRHGWWGLGLVLAASMMLVACGGEGDDDTSTPTESATATATASETSTATGTATATETATESATSTETATATEAPPTGEALGRQNGGATCDALFPDGLEVGQDVEDVFVCIDSPAPGASVGTSVTVSGYQAGSFEQNVVVEVRDASGDAIVRDATTANAPDIGLIVGAWTIDLDVSGGEPASIAAFSESARDGSIDFGGEIEVTP
ncbi:MAG: Gmad2 immunoglobulin-like domain-containing protein [Dehalococcoidia bacterium]